MLSSAPNRRVGERKRGKEGGGKKGIQERSVMVCTWNVRYHGSALCYTSEKRIEEKRVE